MDTESGRNQSNKNEGDTLVVDPVPKTGPSAFNAEEYRPYMAEFDLSEEQANELLATLWEIMKAFVDLGFGVDSIHRFLPALCEISGEVDTGAVESGDTSFSRNFEKAARDGAEKEEDS